MRMRVVHFVAMLSETAQMLRSLKTMEHSEVNMQDLGAYLEESTGVMSKSWLNLEALAFDIDNLADWTSMWARVAIKAKQMHGSIFLGERASEDWERESHMLVKQGNRMNKPQLLKALNMPEAEAASKSKADIVQEYVNTMMEARKGEENSQKEAWLDAQTALIQLACSGDVEVSIEKGVAKLKEAGKASVTSLAKGDYVQVFFLGTSIPKKTARRWHFSTMSLATRK